MIEQALRARCVRGVALLCLLAACGGRYDDEPRGTGKQHQLYVRAPLAPVAMGLRTLFLIDDVRTWPEDAAPEGAERVERWDFAGTELEVDAPQGMDLEVTRQDYPEGRLTSRYRLNVLCAAEPDVPHEVRVRVRVPGGAIRYEDRFDVTCHEPTRLELRRVEHPYAEPSPPGVGRYFAGGALEADVLLFAGALQLGGDGLQVIDRRGILRMAGRMSFGSREGGSFFEVLTEGQGPELVYRNAVLKLPMEAVRDDAWTLELGEWQAPLEAGGPRTLDAFARGSDGSTLRGLLRCTWNFGGEEANPGCRFVQRGSRAPPEMCVSAHGRERCRRQP
ncbi:hypothetical protein [Pyxidicoccus xibeiensis]|uniref:hypothetical protein n=1 Tax=Pyxidicoccus xibeiensis TaxID=2906759 RepID=UPI0020A7D1C1|nr:hypothetical protein [Pyxidicoccus xibeiensis]MCP3140175.1 hypothetical protein [Pyxidicoccus xibeiensis]